MKRVLFYLLRFAAFVCRAFSYRWYMSVLMCAHRMVGVKFVGRPEYIHTDAFLDGSGGLTICEGAVISTGVTVLTHDWSHLKRKRKSKNWGGFKEVVVGDNSFVGAGAILLPGTKVGRNCIIGAGAVVKGEVPDYAIVVGNPSKVIGYTNI